MLRIKSLHTVFVVSWFAGLFYLRRIYLNVNMAPVDSAPERERSRLTARKLLLITTLTAAPLVGFGVCLVLLKPS